MERFRIVKDESNAPSDLGWLDGEDIEKIIKSLGKDKHSMNLKAVLKRSIA